MWLSCCREIGCLLNIVLCIYVSNFAILLYGMNVNFQCYMHVIMWAVYIFYFTFMYFCIVIVQWFRSVLCYWPSYDLWYQQGTVSVDRRSVRRVWKHDTAGIDQQGRWHQVKDTWVSGTRLVCKSLLYLKFIVDYI